MVGSTAGDTSLRDLRRGLTLGLHCGSRLLLGPTHPVRQSFAAKLGIHSAAEDGKAWKGKIRGAIIIVSILEGSLQRAHNLASEGRGALHSCLINKGPPFALKKGKKKAFPTHTASSPAWSPEASAWLSALLTLAMYLWAGSYASLSLFPYL